MKKLPIYAIVNRKRTVVAEALVDDGDWEAVSKHRWSFLNGRYVSSCFGVDGVNKNFLLHRFILGTTDRRVDIDHIDGDRLNNCRANLRVATRSQNMANRPKPVSKKGASSVYKGVSLYQRTGKWLAKIKVNYKDIHLGCFDSELCAAKAYNLAATKHFGAFAQVNVI